MDNLKGKVYFGRANGDKDRFHITLIDENSHCQAIEIYIDSEHIADFFSNRHAECTFDYNTSGVVGKKREHKTVDITFPLLPYVEKEARIIAEPILKSFEKDGWMADRYTVYSSHHKAKHNNGNTVTYLVSFNRYV